MVTEVEMTVWIQSVWSCETVKDQIVDEAHGKREFIPKAGCCMLKRTVCNFEWWGSRWSGYGDNRRGSSTARRLNSEQFRKIRRLREHVRLTIETAGETPDVPAASWVCGRIDHLRVEYDDVVQFSDLVITSGTNEYVPKIPPKYTTGSRPTVALFYLKFYVNAR